jgi:peptide-methionine (S)-S-oxide reductase
VATEKATFGAGCFWGVEARFSEMPGVLDTAVGYEGGSLEHPTYKEVCTDRTGHAEVVQVLFDPSRISYESLLDAFFALHDPTQVNRQGPDWGSQYRTVIFTHSVDQARDARAKIDELNASGAYRTPIATQVVPAETFWKAEEYHQRSRKTRHGELPHLTATCGGFRVRIRRICAPQALSPSPPQISRRRFVPPVLS